MKQHYCPAEKSQMEYEGECNWCGEKEQGDKQMTDLEKELTRQIHELSKELSALRERVAVLEYKQLSVPVVPVSVPIVPVAPKNPWDPPFTVTCAAGSTGIAGRD